MTAPSIKHSYQGSAIYGLPAGFTAYGGGQLSQHYQSLLVGIGKTLVGWEPYPSMARRPGQPNRIRKKRRPVNAGSLVKTFSKRGPISISGYRYSTSGYTLQEVLTPGGTELVTILNAGVIVPRYCLTRISGKARVHLVKRHQRGLLEQRPNNALNRRGFSNSWNGITWSLNYSFNRNTTDARDSDTVYSEDQVFSMSISVPLDRWLSSSRATYNLNTSKHGSTSHTVGLNGTALHDQNLNWSVQESETNHDEGNGGSASLDYQGTYARMNSAYSYDHD
ncbi:MAG: fimbria/pilus outer membrane usher protein [Enterobacter hormaechei]